MNILITQNVQQVLMLIHWEHSDIVIHLNCILKKIPDLLKKTILKPWTPDVLITLCLFITFHLQVVECLGQLYLHTERGQWRRCTCHIMDCKYVLASIFLWLFYTNIFEQHLYCFNRWDGMSFKCFVSNPNSIWLPTLTH